MGKIYDKLSPPLLEFIAAQRLFFVATAPADPGGHLNLSPKGLDGFRVLGDRAVGYLDYNGSGIETIAHVRENARIVFMFCAFEGPPKILRLHGRARVLLPKSAEFEMLLPRFSSRMPVRSIIVAELERIASSCGFGVPLYDYRAERPQAERWAEAKGTAGIAAYQREKNAVSIDGLPGLPEVELR